MNLASQKKNKTTNSGKSQGFSRADKKVVMDTD